MAKKIMISCPRSVENAWAKMLEEATISYIRELAKKRVNFETTSVDEALKLINFEVKTTKKKTASKSKNTDNGNKGPHKRPPGRAKKGKKWCTWRKWVDKDAPEYNGGVEEQKEEEEISNDEKENEEEEERKVEDSNPNKKGSKNSKKKKRRIIKKKKPEPESEEEDDACVSDDDLGFNLSNPSSEEEGDDEF